MPRHYTEQISNRLHGALQPITFLLRLMKKNVTSPAENQRLSLRKNRAEEAGLRNSDFSRPRLFTSSIDEIC
jgi:hypothetical protein